VNNTCAGRKIIMKIRKAVALILSAICMSSVFVSCGDKKDDLNLDGQTAADVALKKVERQLNAAKQAKIDFGMKIVGKDADEEAETDIVDVDGDVTVYALDNSLAWGAELLYAGEQTPDKLFASNSGVGRLVEEAAAYETVDMLPVTATSLYNAFESSVIGSFGSIIENETDVFNDLVHRLSSSNLSIFFPKISAIPTATTVRSPAAARDASAMPVSVSAVICPLRKRSCPFPRCGRVASTRGRTSSPPVRCGLG
jgi:hypothetical protein